MNAWRKLIACASALAFLLLAAGSQAQFPGMQGPPSMRGVWAPVVGSGAAYEVIDRRGEKNTMEVAIVGTETVPGGTAHWLELVIGSKQGEMVMKQLTTLKSKELAIMRMIMQPPGEQPIEMSMEMMGMMNRGAQRAMRSDVRESATLVGTESITVPAGTFSCQHFKTADGDDVWISDKVTPWGLVKATSKEHSMTLLRTVTNAKTRVTGTPRSMGDMMRRPS